MYSHLVSFKTTFRIDLPLADAYIGWSTNIVAWNEVTHLEQRLCDVWFQKTLPLPLQTFGKGAQAAEYRYLHSWFWLPCLVRELRFTVRLFSFHPVQMSPVQPIASQQISFTMFWTLKQSRRHGKDLPRWIIHHRNCFSEKKTSSFRQSRFLRTKVEWSGDSKQVGDLMIAPIH